MELCGLRHASPQATHRVSTPSRLRATVGNGCTPGFAAPTVCVSVGLDELKRHNPLGASGPLKQCLPVGQEDG